METRETMEGRMAPVSDPDRTRATTSDSVLLQIIEQLFIARLTRRLPMDRDRSLRSDGSFAIGRDNADEVTILHNLHARHRIGRFGIARDELCFER